MKSKVKGVYSMDSQKMTSGYLEGRIIDKSLIEGSTERSHQPRNVGLDGSGEESRHLMNSCLQWTSPDADKATFKNRFSAVERGSRDDLNSLEATDVRIQSEGMANIQHINIKSNLGSAVLCGNSEFNFDAKSLKTEVKAKQLNDESLKTVPKQPPLDGKPLDDDQLKHGSFNACNRSEFCLEEATNSESSCKVYTAHQQPTNINDNCGIVLTLTRPMSNQLIKRNINILNNFGTILVCENTEILFNVLSSNSVELKQNNEGIIIFDGKQLRGGQSNTKYGLAKSQNRSEFCLRQAVGLSTTEEEVKFEALNATCGDQAIQICDNSGIVIIPVGSGQHHSNASKASDCEEPADEENIEISNNFGNTVVCHDSRVNINLLSKEAIRIVNVHDRSTVALHQKVMFDTKQLEDRLLEIRISSLTRSEFCQS